MADFHDILVRVRWVQEGIRDFGRGLTHSTSEMKNNLGIMQGQERAGRRLGVQFKRLFVGLHGFRMEMLSVMFFGLGMQRFFGGLIRPATEMVGVWDVLSTALGILFLPFAFELLDWAMKFLGWVQNMDPNTQKMINTFVKWGIILGTLLFVIGSFVLGIGGIISAFGPLISIILALVTSPLALLLAAFVAITAAVVGKEALGPALEWLGKTGDKAFQAILNKFPALKSALEKAGIDTTSLGTAWESIYEKKIKPTIDKIAAAFGIGPPSMKLRDDFIKMSPKFAEKAKQAYAEEGGLFCELVRKFKDAWDGIFKWFKDVWAEKFPEIRDKLVEFGKSVGTAIWEGLKQIIPQPLLTTIGSGVIGGAIAGPPGAVLVAATGFLATEALTSIYEEGEKARTAAFQQQWDPLWSDATKRLESGLYSSPVFNFTINVSNQTEKAIARTIEENVTTNLTRIFRP